MKISIISNIPVQTMNSALTIKKIAFSTLFVSIAFIARAQDFIPEVTIRSQATDASGLNLMQSGAAESRLLNQANGPLILGTNNTERLRIDANGNVGIGKTNPEHTLDVGNTDFPPARFNRNGNGMSVIFSRSDVRRGYISTNSQSTNALDIVSYGDLGLGTNGQLDKMTIAVNGNVGIGTSSPAMRLMVEDDATDGFIAGFFNNAGSTDGNGGADRDESLIWIGGLQNTTHYGVHLGSVNNNNSPSKHNSDFIIKTNAETGPGHLERFRVTHSGNVGIGTNSPAHALHVAGNFLIRTPGGLNRFFIDNGKDEADAASAFLYDAAGSLTTRIDADGKTYFNGGKVGIGTASPTGRLSVGTSPVAVTLNSSQAATFFEGENTQVTIFGTANSTGNGPRLQLFENNSNKYGVEWFYDAGDNLFEQTFYANSSDINSFTQGFAGFSFDGNVGIGTTSPAQLFHVQGGDAVIRSPNGENRFYFARGDDDEAGGIFYAYDNTANNTIRLHSEGSSYITGGNVGIGTTTPDSKLTVVGHVNVGGEGNAWIKARHINGKHWQNSGYHELLLNYHTGYAVKVGFGNQDANLLVSGDVGIGTTTPEAKLTVDGDIRATKVQVVADVNSVPDYVFSEDYELQSLEEVEAYVKENSHLPEVPSAEEIAEEGHDLGAMNLLLLKKIEELTLYLIDERKQNQKQQEEIAELRAAVEALRGSDR